MNKKIITLIVLVFALCGCATTNDVKEIVSRSNTAMLTGAPVGGTGEDQPDWKEEVGRIEDFISLHPEAEVTNATLRVRQGMLLTVNKQDALATMAFDQVEPSKLFSSRDRALFALHEHLIWWFKISEDYFSDEDYGQAQSALVDFSKQCDLLPAGSEARMYLEEMRAWIGSAYAKNSTDPGIAQSIFLDGFDRYAAQFTSDDINWIKANVNADAGQFPFLFLKRRLRSREVVKEYRKVADDQGLSFELSTSQQTRELLGAVP